MKTVLWVLGVVVVIFIAIAINNRIVSTKEMQRREHTPYQRQGFEPLIE